MRSLSKQTLSVYWSHSIKYKWLIFLVVTGIVGITAGETYTPFLYKNFFNILARNGTDGLHQLLIIVWVIGAVQAVTWIFRRTLDMANIKFQARVMSDLLNTCYKYLQSHSYQFFTNNFAGSLVRKVSRYTRSFEDLGDQVVYSAGQTVIRILTIIAVLAFRQWLLAAAVFVWCAAFAAFNIWFSNYKIKYDIERSAMDTKATGHLADTIANNINLKLFGGVERERIKYHEITEDLHDIRYKSWLLSSKADAIQSFLLVLLEMGTMFIAIVFWKKGTLTIGDFALIQAYLAQIYSRIWDIGRFTRKIYESMADANEMTEILLTPHEVLDKPGAKKLKVSSGAISFKDVSFGYGRDKNIFKKFNLLISGGERIALIGPSGGGKTTITKLLFRFFDIQKGRILIDGQDIAEMTQESLRANLALVPQEPILFHRTLMENIRYARPKASDREVVAAAKLAHCHEFIATFPEGYKTYVGERGVKLSGGERQRVAIARAILKNAPILVLDEATSSLDSESEKYIQDALKKLMEGKTTIVIAHRLSTIMQMDRIVVIEKGRITEQGKHEELIKAGTGTYQKLWEIQAGSFA